MGSKTTSQVTNTPNPTASAAYNNVINQAQSVASTPYTPYTGELTAGLNGGQQRAIGQLEGAYGTARPFFDGGTQQLANAAGGLGNVSNYLQAGSESTAGVQPYQAAASNQYGQANNLIGDAITGLGGVSTYQNAAADSYGAMGGMIGSADTAYGQAGQSYGQASAGLGQVGQYLNNANGYFGQAASLATPQDFNGADGVSKYMNPYTQSVIDTTMATARQNDAAQTASVVGNAIGSGAYGGDRNGIAVAALSGQQDMANNSTIAGLNQANYSQATAQFNATQAQRQAGAGIYANLGQGELQAGNTQLNDALGYAQVGAGQNANAAGYAGLGSLYATQGQGYAGLGQLQGQTAQEYGSLAGTSTGIGAGYNSTGQLGLGTAAEYGTLGQLQGTTGQAYGTLGGLYGNLGTQAQSAATSGASAGLQGATLQQQTQQAQDTANYGQFQNQIQYPFNETGFLSNIVQGIGSASGGTSTTQGSGLSQIAGAATSGLGVLGVTGAFGANGYLTGAGGLLSSVSDERAKDDKQPIGKTFDGQTIYSFRYKGDPKTNIGLMAQEVEGRTPDAVSHPVGLGGLKAVDYGKATQGAAERGHFARGGGLGNVARMLGAPDQIRVGGLGGVRPHFDAGGGLGTVDGSLQSNAFAQDLAHNPLSGGVALGGARNTMPGGNTSGMPSGGQSQGASSGGGGLGALTAAPSSGGGLSNLSGSGGGFGGGSQGNGSSDTFGAGNDKLWMSLIAGGAGAMSGGSASGLANIGKGISDGMSEYQGLKNADRQNALAQSEIQSRAAETALATRRQDFTEAQANRLINASNNVAKILQNSTDPTNAQTAGAPAPSTPQPAAAPVPALAASSAPADPVPSPAPQAAASQPVGAGDFWARVSPENNPALLAQQAAQFNKMGQAYLGQGFSEQANQMFTQANSLVNRGRQITDAGYVNMRDGTVQTIPGFTAAKAGQAATTSAATAAAKAGVDNQNALVAIQPTPGGPVQYVTKAQALQMANGAGGQPGELVKEQPAYMADKQKAMATNEGEMSQQFQQRQISLQRINEMQGIQQKYQTGDLAGAKADAVAFGRAMGIPVSDNVTASPENFQRFGKDAYGNVFSDLKAAGGKPMVAEIDGLIKANANSEMSPAANAAILSQAKGIINYQDQHYQDYLGWKKQNPYATDTGEFDTSWAKAHPLGAFVDSARKDTAYQGQALPKSASEAVDGQLYMTKQGPLRWNAAKGKFFPDSQGRSQ